MKKTTTLNVIFLIIAIILCFSFSIYKRNQQLDHWMKNKSQYFANNYLPSVSTMDAYYWLKYAKDKLTDVSEETEKSLRGFPSQLPYPENIPFFSKILAYGHKFFKSDGFDPLYFGSLKLSILFSSLFIIPLIIYLYLADAGTSGILGALIGTFSITYYQRTSVGRVDTDGLLMFLPLLIALVLLIALKTKKLSIKYFLAGGVALSFYLLSELHFAIRAASVGYFILLITALLLDKTNKKQIIGIAITYIILSNPLQIFISTKEVFAFLGSAYLLDKTKDTLDAMAMTVQTVSEAKTKSYNDVIFAVIKNNVLFIIGAIGTIALFITKFKNMIFLLPVLFLGIMPFFSSIRFSMFSGIFIGAGCGYIIWIITKYLFKILNSENKLYTNVASAIIILIFFFSVKGYTAYDYTPSPAIPVETAESILNLKEKLPENSVIYTWWDLGYPLEALGNFTTISDGGLENIEHRFALAKGFFLNNQNQLYNWISYISNEGLNEIKNILRKKDNEKLTEIVTHYQKTIPQNLNIYILYSSDLIDKLWNISKYATLINDNNKKTYYNKLKCFKYSNGRIFCEKYDIDVIRGSIVLKKTNQKAPLNRINRVINGYIAKNNFYNNLSRYYITFLLKNNNVKKILFYTSDMENTVFNNQYILGKINQEKFTEVFNNFPKIRVFKLNN